MVESRALALDSNFQAKMILMNQPETSKYFKPLDSPDSRDKYAGILVQFTIAVLRSLGNAERIKLLALSDDDICRARDLQKFLEKKDFSVALAYHTFIKPFYFPRPKPHVSDASSQWHCPIQCFIALCSLKENCSYIQWRAKIMHAPEIPTSPYFARLQ